MGPRVRLLLLAVLFALVACRRHRRVVVIHDPNYGTLDAHVFGAEELAEDVAFVRARLASPEALPPKLAMTLVGRRVFLTLYGPNDPVVATGLGPTLGAALAAAADDARRGLTNVDLGSVRVLLDVTTGRTKGVSEVAPEDLGREGFLVSRDPAHVGWVTPAELLHAGLLLGEDKPALDEKGVEQRLVTRLGGPCPTCARSRFSTVSVVEARPSGPLRTLVRGRLPRPAEMDVPELRRRIALAATHLAGLVDEKGHYSYLYDPIRDRDDTSDYSVIRHAGATHSLFEAYEELRDPAILAAGERALGWLDRKLSVDGDKVYLADEDNAYGHIGGTGLALVAFAKHAAVTRDAKYLARMRAMGAFLVGQLDPGGRFLPYFPKGGPTLEEHEVLYYPGEATLGLMRLHALDPRPAWIEAVTRVSARRIGLAYVPPSDEWRDYWFALTIAELYRVTKDPRWTERSWVIADGILRDQDDDEADLARSASFTVMPGASGVSTALEALATQVALARLVGRDEAAMMRHARRAATFIASQQHDDESVFPFKNRAKILGGIRGDAWLADVRIDLAQHAMMAWLCVLRVQRDPAFGKMGSPSPLPVVPL